MRTRPSFLAASLATLLSLLPIARSAAGERAAGTFVDLLWLAQSHGNPDLLLPERVPSLKNAIALVHRRQELGRADVAAFLPAAAFDRLAGADGVLARDEIRAALAAGSPASRRRLRPGIAAHVEELTTELERIAPEHREAVDSIVEWIATSYRPGRRLDILCVCTGNSRRSMMSATMGNIAAAYYGLPGIRFSSAGTEPSAFNPRAIRALREIGVSIERAETSGSRTAFGVERPNPRYRVRWGRAEEGDDPALEAIEFSKRYDDPANPREAFAALMVCSEASESCPDIPGADVRIPLPFLDPKVYDDSRFEHLKYAERRDDIGRIMISIALRARRALERRGVIGDDAPPPSPGPAPSPVGDERSGGRRPRS